MAKLLYTFINPTSKRHIAEACRILADDGVIAYPTDVNWAFGCDAASVKAIDRIHRLKPMHPMEQPFSLMCDTLTMVSSVGIIENFSYRLLKKVLPGPYTFLLRRAKNLPRQIHDKRKIVGVRVPNSPLLLDLIAAYGKPIATSSVPISSGGGGIAEGQPFKYGHEIEGVYGHGIDLILDLGEEVTSLETTIIDVSDGAVVVVRKGEGPVDGIESA